MGDPEQTKPLDPETMDAVPPALQAWLASDQPWRKLAGVHEDLRVRVWRIFVAMAVLGYRMMVTDGLRSTQQQQAEYRKGRRNLKNEKVVTWADGVNERSSHQTAVSGPYVGFATAVDCTFCDEKGEPRWSDDDPWNTYGHLAKSLSLEWGGDWPNNKRDRPHIELSRRA